MKLFKKPPAAPGHEASGLAWIKPADVPLDHEGPVAVPFDPPSADFVERPIYELFEIVAARHAAAFALADGVGKLTYADVRYAVRLLAGEIATRTPTGKAIAVLLPNVPASVIGVLACLAAGRCCLVLNADHPAERNAAILRDADVHAVVIKNNVCPEISLVPDGVTRIVMAGGGSAEGGTAVSWRCPTPIAPDEPAIVLYTSGSTGQPKGIVLSQATVLARVRNNIVSMHLNSDDRFLSLGALGTTAGLVASIVALLGGSMQFVMSAPASGAGSLLSLIRDERVTILWGVPALLRLLFEADGARGALTSLRLVRTFGDRLLKADLEGWRAVLPGASHVAITYGQTEVTAAQWFVPAGFTSNEAALPTGYLLPEHQFAVVDETGSPVGEGEIGELTLRSRYVALGTWEHGRCAAGRARSDQSEPLLRILATGDLVRLRQDGLLQIIGRRDRQVKIRGQRVEPAEIEDVLRRVSGVADAAIAARGNGEETSLLAFIVAGDPSDTALLDRARTAIRTALPSYMQPARILLADRLPLLPGGKVDEKALLAIEAATPREQRPRAPAPAASLRARRAVNRAWLRTLDRRSLDADLPFEEAGGDSLRLLRFIFHLEEHCRATLPLDAFYADLRPSDFAHVLDRCLDPAPNAPEASLPLFLMPGMGKDEPRLVHFRAACAPALRIVPVDYGDWPEWVAPSFDFAALLARLLLTIEAQAPDGPIFLAGYSLGGTIAYAAAAAFSAAGRSVGFLGILDTNIAQTAPSRVPRKQPSRRQELRDLIGAMRRGEGADDLARIAVSRLASPRWKPVLRLAAHFRHFRLPGDIGFYLHFRLRMALLEQLVQAWSAGMVAPVQPLHVPSMLFRCEAHPANTPDDLGWRERCPDITAVPVGGDHQSMFDPPNLETLSRRFTAAALHARDEAERGAGRVVASTQ